MSLPTPGIPAKHLVDRSVTELVATEDLYAQLQDRLTSILATQRASLATLSPDADLLVDAWTPMLMGGKRLRAAFAYWAWRAYGGDRFGPQAPGMIRVCAALELFQAAALFHDDVMDRSDTRRGIPTAHRAFAAAHTSGGLLGDGEQYGLSAAILLGDLSLVVSENEFRAGTRDFDRDHGDSAHTHFDAMRTVVTVGQFLDVHAQVATWSPDLSQAEARALKVIETKTASYSVNSPLQIGAALAGASATEHEALAKFGIPVGMAYQLVDDLLGMFGDPSETGKPAGDDIREGKRTVLIIEALRRVSPADRTRLENSLGDQDLTDEQVRDLIELVRSSGAVEATEARIAELSSRGLAALANLAITGVGADMLNELTRIALSRRA